MKTISTPCSREAHSYCAGCYCDCHPINFDDELRSLFSEFEDYHTLTPEQQRAFWQLLHDVEVLHLQSFRHDVESSER